MVFQQRRLNSSSDRFATRYGTLEEEVLERLRILLRDYLKLGLNWRLLLAATGCSIDA